MAAVTTRDPSTALAAGHQYWNTYATPATPSQTVQASQARPPPQVHATQSYAPQVQSSYVAPTVQSYTSAVQTYAQQPTYVTPVRAPVVRDDYERWYMENSPSNRMVLALRSGIDHEVNWALERLCRVCHNEQFVFSSLPGLLDALFEWPEWYASDSMQELDKDTAGLFSNPPSYAAKRQHALESMFILRNASLCKANVDSLATHSHTMALIVSTLRNLDVDASEHAEFILHVIEFLHAVANRVILSKGSAPGRAEPLPALQHIASVSSNRALIMAALAVIPLMVGNRANMHHLTPDAPALSAAIRFLPLFEDKPLLDVSLNYLYTHLSHPPMAKAFLWHPQMPNAVRLLVSLLISEQVEEPVTVDISGPIQVLSDPYTPYRPHELSAAEMDVLLMLPQEQQCIEWLKLMFIAKPDGEMTQIELWKIYNDCFSPRTDKLLVAADVIKTVNVAFPQAQAMVLQPGPRFVVRGLERRMDYAADRFQCRWYRSACLNPPFSGPGELYEHALTHLDEASSGIVSCSWVNCAVGPLPKARLRAHILTHIATTQLPSRDPSQSVDITLPLSAEPLPPNQPFVHADPTTRTPPPPRQTTIEYQQPTADPPSTSLTALLCIRILFRTSFASAEVAPRVDGDHFGFPGIVEDDDADTPVEADDLELQGEMKGRKVFYAVRHLMQGVRIRDEVLMSWIDEMVDI